MSYPITQKFISKNRSGQPLIAIGMALHCTDDLGATDENEQSYFNNNNISASAHAFIDWDSITETVPDSEVALHAGPTANHKFLGVELCEPANHNPSQFQEVWNRAVWYFANKFINKLKITTITKDNLMSHSEISSKYKETDHQDPVAYFKEYGKTVDDFRADVQAEISNQLTPAIPARTSILKFQQALNKLEIHDGKGNSLIEDGILGSCTKEAIKRIQTICGLTADGIAGDQTWNAINTILAKPLLKVGVNGIPTRYLQYRVGTSYDGIFGNGTKAAVVKFQNSNGLASDGVVGPNTWSKLIS